MRRHIDGILLFIVALVPYAWQLDRNGWANEYYAAAARSMSRSWHDFWFASFDPAGIMSLDKPPLAAWVQAASVHVFGFNSWALLMPQAVMGALAVLLVWAIARPQWGRVAGLVAGVALLATPIATAMSRHNNPDALLVLLCTGALWATLRTCRTGRIRWAALAGVLVGLGFLTKLGAALLVVPGLAVAWLLAAPTIRRALTGTAAFVFPMVAVAISWPLTTVLVASGKRPWLSGTSDDSIWSLIVGYNGAGRVTGQAGGGGGMGGGSGIFGGSAGLLRLFNESLSGQIGWLLGGAVAVLVVGFTMTRGRRDPRLHWLVAVCGWLLVAGGVFSVASGIFHPYYVSLLAPPVALLIGAGAGLLGELRGIELRVVAPTLVASAAAGQLAVAIGQGDSAVVAMVVLPLALATVVAALVSHGRAAALAAAGVAGLALLWTPASWSVQTLGHATAGTFPSGGPSSQSMGMGGGGGGMFGGSSSSVDQALAYVRANGGGVLAISSQSDATAAIIDGATDLAAIGGFSGNESEVTIDWLADRVEAGDIRWLLTSSDDRTPSMGRTGARDVLAAAATACTAASGDDAPSGLVDCQGKADALRTAGD